MTAPLVLIVEDETKLARLLEEYLQQSGFRTQHLERCEAHVGGRLLELTAVELRLLSALLEHPGWVFSRNQLMDHLYRDNRVVTDRTVDSHIKNLRRKLAERLPDREVIRSVYGVGYKLELRRMEWSMNPLAILRVRAYALAYAYRELEEFNMDAERHVRLFRNGRNQALRIPRDFELPGNEAVLRKEGNRLIIEPAKRRTLLQVLESLEPLTEDFPEIEDRPPDDVPL